MFWGYASNMLKSPGLHPLGKPHFHSTLSLGKASPPFKPKALKVWEKPHLHSTNPIIQSNTLSPKILTPDIIGSRSHMYIKDGKVGSNHSCLPAALFTHPPLHLCIDCTFTHVLLCSYLHINGRRHPSSFYPDLTTLP